MTNHHYCDNVKLLIIGLLGVCWAPAHLSATILPIEVAVHGGGGEVADWVIEQDLDLSSWFDDAQVDLKRIGVIETDEAGRELATTICQIDPATVEGLHTVCWQVAGALSPKQTRHFRIKLREQRDAPAPDEPVGLKRSDDQVIVTNTSITMTHRRVDGGLIGTVRVNESQAQLKWGDKLADGRAEYKISGHNATRIDVLATGPLRAAYQCRTEYLYGSKRAASRPIATYRFTTYAGQPVTHIQAIVDQNFAEQWQSLHFIELHLADLPVDAYITGSEAGRLSGSGRFFGGKQWAAVYGDRMLVGVCRGASPGIWDGGGDFYPSYLRAAVAVWSSERAVFQSTLFWGAGEQDLGALKDWSLALANPPTVTVNAAKLTEQLAALAERVHQQNAVLKSVTGEPWARRHVSLLPARMLLRSATVAVQRGNVAQASRMTRELERCLEMNATTASLTSAGSLTVGTVEGHPFLANDQVAFVWSSPQRGCGLISIYDKKAGAELLSVHPGEAPLWQATYKNVAGATGGAYQNVGSKCKVIHELDEQRRQGRLIMRWDKDLNVQVTARLTEQDPFLRLTINIKTKHKGDGLLTVTFPYLRGVAPLTDGAQRDAILETASIGGLTPSPLFSGKQINKLDYPNGDTMQFTALLGDGRGLYLAQEDEQANRKGFRWIADFDAQRLDLHINHPVLDWGGAKPVSTYASPGDIVIGPFKGDWYDACRIYRKWALTAPWCRRGPLASREDYPRWAAELPYWTIGSLGHDAGVRSEIVKHEFFGLPAGAVHAYGYFYAHHQDDRYPEYFPPKLGSANFVRVIRQLQSIGMRVIPYVNGRMWDTDAESYKAQRVAQEAAIHDANANPYVTDSYGFGQRIAVICPASRLWRRTMLDVVKELVGKYGVDGIYFDWLTVKIADCHNPGHGHPIGGGNYWTGSVHEFYSQLREASKKLRPDSAFAAENTAEYVIDVIDLMLTGGANSSTAPAFLAVYHGYTHVFGGISNRVRPEPRVIGRRWLMGAQNGWHDWEYLFSQTSDPRHAAVERQAKYYRKLVRCTYRFGLPYLGYGEMLRPPTISGEFPILDAEESDGPFKVPAVEASAWKAPDGSVAIFLLNYDDTPHEVTCSFDLQENPGWSRADDVSLFQWSEQRGLTHLGGIKGGKFQRKMRVEPWGLISLKLRPGLPDQEPNPVPAGCVAAEGAKLSAGGYMDRIIHKMTGIELVLVPAGSAKLGESNFAVTVTFSKPFYISRTEVTNGEYRRFHATGYDGEQDTDPAYELYLLHQRRKSTMPAGEEFPVAFVSWKNAKAFCQWAGNLDLPSEAEWEYACLAGSTSAYHFGNDQRDFAKYGWALVNSDGRYHPVGQLKPNAWDLYDMHGNLWEWTLDDYVDNKPVALDGSAQLSGQMTKVLKGGSWSNTPAPASGSARSRFNSAPTNAGNDIGFRVVLRSRS